MDEALQRDALCRLEFTTGAETDGYQSSLCIAPVRDAQQVRHLLLELEMKRGPRAD
jgi:hypothetical protein